jgi:acetylornithine deacetylase
VLGVPTVVCGPGDIAQAHQPNEFILASQIDAGEAFMKRMLEWSCRELGPGSGMVKSLPRP